MHSTRIHWEISVLTGGTIDKKSKDRRREGGRGRGRGGHGDHEEYVYKEKEYSCYFLKVFIRRIRVFKILNYLFDLR